MPWPRLHYNYSMKDAHARALKPDLDTRYQQLIKRIQQLPPVGSRPLTVAGRVAGWITAKATSHLEGLPGIHIGDEAVHITAALPARLPLDAVLAQLAAALKDTGCLRGWRNELLDVYGEGRRLACMERAAMRPLGLLTKAVHLNAWSPDGRMWVARRALDKSTDPGMWDTLVGGLAGAGENLDTALLRESYEEAGLSAADIQNRSATRIILRMHRRLPEGYQVEDVLVSDCVLDDSVTPKNMDGEVSEVQLVTIAELWAMVEDGAFTREAELAILDGLKTRMQQGLLL
jgi:8-oxo-dGTP pyrophosphatase MutT (NUDIX family)